jgi:hypothetical protein
MFGLLVLSTTAIAPLPSSAVLPCDGIRLIEVAVSDRPLPFASLREQGKTMAYVRDASGQRVRREVPITNVKAISGFARCRFVYSSQIDFACYIGATLPVDDVEAVAGKLNSTSESVGHCLTNTNLVRKEAEEGSTPVVTFGAGARQPFWQVSMVPLDDDPTRVQPEVLVLGPAEVAPVTRTTTRPTKARPKAKRKTR